MGVVPTLETALWERKIRIFAGECGMQNVDSASLIECSKYINSHISKTSTYTPYLFGVYLEEFIHLPIIKRIQANTRDFENSLVCPLLLGETVFEHEDIPTEVYPIRGAVFRNNEGELYTLFRDQGKRRDHMYYFNSRLINDLFYGKKSHYITPMALNGVLNNAVDIEFVEYCMCECK